jgi:polygalacturonase
VKIVWERFGTVLAGRNFNSAGKADSNNWGYNYLVSLWRDAMINIVPLYTKTRRPSSGLFLSAGLALLATFWSIGPAHAATFNVKNYGAKGDGTTDDSESIAKAIQAANGAANTVLFPTGFYLIGDLAPTLRPVSVTLKGEDNAVLNFSASAAQIVMGASTVVDKLTIANTGSDKGSGIVGDGLQSYAISHSTFRGWKGNSVKLTNSIGTLQNNSFFVDSTSTGILLDGCDFTTIDDNKFTGSNSGISGVGVSFVAEKASNHLRATNNTFSVLRSGIKGSNGVSASSYLGIIEGTNNTFVTCFFGANVQGLSGLSVSSNKFQSIAASINVDQVDQATIIENTFDSASNSAGGVSAEAVHSLLTISGNKFKNVGQFGIELINNPNLSVDNNSFTTSEQGSAISLDSDQIKTVGNTITVSNNKLTGFLVGIQSQKCRGLVESFNTISECSGSGIYSVNDFRVSIQSNKLSNCGLQPGQPDAVIFVDPAAQGQGQLYGVNNNSYTGNVQNLTYFVHVKDSKQNNVDVSGNTTNTMLPSKP